MTNDEIKIAIAEACGYKRVRPCFHVDGGGYGEYDEAGRCLREAPNYPADLNAMHSAWLTLPLELKFLFASILHDVVERDYDAANGKGAFAALSPSLQLAEISNATAPQRSETFLRTHNKWKD